MQVKLFCLLDILGFSNLIQNESLESIYEKYKMLISAANDQHHDGLVFSSWAGTPYFGYEMLEFAYFSDTIIFWSPYDVRHFHSLAQSMMEVMCRSIEIELPLRGTISVGQAILDKDNSEFLGRPIVNAVRAEKVQRWIGVTLSSEFREAPYNCGFSADCFIPYECHLKEGGSACITPLVLDFPRHWRATRKSSLQSAIQALDCDSRFSLYYKNAVDFVDFSNKNVRWWESHPDFKKHNS